MHTVYTALVSTSGRNCLNTLFPSIRTSDYAQHDKCLPTKLCTHKSWPKVSLGWQQRHKIGCQIPMPIPIPIPNQFHFQIWSRRLNMCAYDSYLINNTAREWKIYVWWRMCPGRWGSRGLLSNAGVCLSACCLFLPFGLRPHFSSVVVVVVHMSLPVRPEVRPAVCQFINVYGF